MADAGGKSLIPPIKLHRMLTNRNTLGRQRMLSQRMVKALFEVEKPLPSRPRPRPILNEVAQASQLLAKHCVPLSRAV